MIGTNSDGDEISVRDRGDNKQVPEFFRGLLV